MVYALREDFDARWDAYLAYKKSLRTPQEVRHTQQGQQGRWWAGC